MKSQYNFPIRNLYFEIIDKSDLFAALERADQIAKQADVIAALSLDVLKGTTRAFDAGWLSFQI